jgi:hypothetical protein
MSAFDIGTVTADDISPHLDSDFRLRAADAEIVGKLAEVRRLGAAKRAGGAFSLLFVAGGGPQLHQATYPLSHPVLGRLDIFLVPIGPVKGGTGYEAVFT